MTKKDFKVVLEEGLDVEAGLAAEIAADVRDAYPGSVGALIGVDDTGELETLVGLPLYPDEVEGL